MDDHLSVIFQTEIELQCRFVLYGAGALERLKETQAEKQAEVDIDDAWAAAWDEYQRQHDEARQALQRLRDFDVPGRTWFAVQAILTAAANLSKLLWGSSDALGAESRRAPLRQSIGVGDDSPLRPLKVRNLFEHIDEKIDRRFKKPGRKLYYGRNMGYYEPPHREGKLEDFFRYFDPTPGS